jgi:serine/threonine protein kinase
VKPQNILLDESFVAKVSDFGMATLMSRKESRVVTTMRGTPGYLPPEWLLDCPITEKSDVYSFGMVVLEIIGGRKNYNKRADSDKCYFPAWALSMAVVGRELEVIDSRLSGDDDFDGKQAIRLLQIGFLCIQEDAHSRPSMRAVVQMLEGEKEVPDTLQEGFQVAMAKRFNPNSRLLSAGNNSMSR